MNTEPTNINTPENSAEVGIDVQRLVLLLNEAYVFLGMPHKPLHPWRVALDKWQGEVEDATGWTHFDEVKKFEQNAEFARIKEH